MKWTNLNFTNLCINYIKVNYPKYFTIRLQILTLYMFTIQDSKIPLRIFYLVLIKIFAKTNFHTEGTNYGVN